MRAGREEESELAIKPAPIHDHSAVDPHEAYGETGRRKGLGGLPEKDSSPLQLFRVSLRVSNPRPNVLKSVIAVSETALFSIEMEG